MRGFCSDCKVRLTSEEVEYYGDRCEMCEQEQHERIGRWLDGAEDPLLEREIFTGEKTPDTRQ